MIGETNHFGALKQKDSIFMLINNYVMDARGQCVAPNFPNTFDIDYVRVYQSPGWYDLRASQSLKGNNIPSGPFSVYPTAVTDMLNVKSSMKMTGTVLLDLINTMGGVVSNTTKSFDNNSEIQFDMSKLTSGMYYLRVKSGPYEKVFKVIKL